jgi:CubicO group peptidase (beta-lactamase class C family)
MSSPAEVGMEPAVLARVDSLITSAIADRATPGAAVAIGRHGKLIKLQGYGRLDYRPGYGAVTEASIYDLASLTKVVGTTSAAMMLVDEGRLDLDAPLSRYLPEWQHYADKQQIKIRNLLQHNAGFKAFAPFYRSYAGRKQYFEAIALLPLDYPTGEKTIYSDFSVILLALAIERVTGMPIDEFLHTRLFGPLGMNDTGYNPAEKLHERVAPTEVDTVFRKVHVHGVVHDENAFALGGVAGHAGLFSSARDLARFAQMLLSGGEYAGRRFINANTIAQFTQRQSESSSRALGWDTPSANSSAGDYFSPTSFGHTGFTGTSMWLDPEKDLFVILLTNRVNPTRDNQKVGPLRRAFADAVQQAIIDTPSARREWTLP